MSKGKIEDDIDMSDGGYTFKAGTQLQHEISDEEFLRMAVRTCCACLHIEFQPESLVNGLKRERWLCNLCNAEFVRKPQTIPGETLGDRQDRMEQNDKLQKNINRLQQLVDKATHTAICAWCGYEIVREDKIERGSAVANHMLDCKDHPLSKRIAELVEELDRLRAELRKKTHLPEQ